MVAMPTQLFRSTGIPVCIWFLARDKSTGEQGAIDRRGELLFIDARQLGYMLDRAERALSDEDISRIADTYHAWKGTDSAARKQLTYEDVPGFCKSVTIDDVKAAGYTLTPGRFVGSAGTVDDIELIDEKIARLRRDLLSSFDESAQLEELVRTLMGRLDV